MRLGPFGSAQSLRNNLANSESTVILSVSEG